MASEKPDDNQVQGAKKPSEAIKCPRCDSLNTKFCYYNNYSLTQPRHFCKTCRRYWTKGGALRNVPLGGGCRKSKKAKSNSRFSDEMKESSAALEPSVMSKIFNGYNPSVEIQLGGLPFSRLQTSSNSSFNQFLPFADLSSSISNSTSSSCTALENASSSGFLGLGYPFGSSIHELAPVNVHSSVASSIQSLSSLNQDLHWKLQQQRWATLINGVNKKDNSCIQSIQPNSFHMPSTSKTNASMMNPRKISQNQNVGSTEWFFDHGNHDDAYSSSGFHSWSDLQQYNSIP